ncbi:hypothetical protein ACJJID_11565 [Microbulbifer sp. CnH-101-G]|uniref:hypothetical protein n=1 Tax=Microbulbifer sp. CnH-101-G TaxID=3243393 RepID=UPI004039E8BE
MNMKGIIWGIISYVVLWLSFSLFINVYGMPINAMGVLLALCSILAGVVAAKNSKIKPFKSAAISGCAVGIAFSLANLIFGDGLNIGVIYIIIEISLYFVVGAVVWWGASFLTRQ